MKPYVILNAAMTLDGKIATKTGSSEISGKEDLERVHEIRKKVDGIMVGIGTVLADDPRLTVHKINARKEDNPIRIVVDNKARTPLNFRILNDDAETIIAVSSICDERNENCDEEAVKRAKELEKRVNVFYSTGETVDLVEFMEYLYDYGIKSIMLEGGSTLNFSMIRDGLIDEVKICIAPMIVGGKDSKTFFDGDGFDYMKDAVQLELINSFPLGKDFIMEYKVLK
ncbi:diaminohydroxyphosphoribosylaminopyrimidine reductase RibD [Methanobrevibacter ruminantium M1]|uniref:2,5-diamino-6-(ribosylamino)-4(3H)-pyrimidinone 5'-phosphate reductase n=1 Tax=Methanobrevibacter ruminantium (strain ATCC 35063 / DSM 1093 / JCM 13430 / OCM 146 / M1) TaxID=634498 RepID=D3E2U7_METRM|nr:2,5-diamino-6-(ribosylamino)-4(3H)-pyrimidinone 5'-phosphate reductase [Methanobrevibacter ruminantium]ADC46858.1 diaminohydroxyphosphoribosylaminopyrimidine reductase RibD [Methanobrevibacter ruminantium M1]